MGSVAESDHGDSFDPIERRTIPLLRRLKAGA